MPISLFPYFSQTWTSLSPIIRSLDTLCNSWCSRTSQLLKGVSLVNLLAISLQNLPVIYNVKESYATDRSIFTLFTNDRFCRFLLIPKYFTEAIVCKAKILHILLNNLQVWSILEAKKGTSRSYEDMGPKNCTLAVPFCTRPEFDRKGVSLFLPDCTNVADEWNCPKKTSMCKHL